MLPVLCFNNKHGYVEVYMHIHVQMQLLSLREFRILWYFLYCFFCSCVKFWNWIIFEHRPPKLSVLPLMLERELDSQNILVCLAFPEMIGIPIRIYFQGLEMFSISHQEFWLKLLFSSCFLGFTEHSIHNMC